MKREAHGHTKMKRLCKLLDLPLWGAVGILESLWKLTAQEAPQGDIGKLSDEDIALGIDWKGDPGKLLMAIKESRWVDVSEQHRYVIHDWSGVADNSVRFHLMRKGLRFVDGSSPHPNLCLRVEGSTVRTRRRDREFAAGFVTSSIRRTIFLRDGNACLICGAAHDLTIDHIIPISRGGRSTIDNLQTLCRFCNARKSNRVEAGVSYGA